jgi:hypothetical protein
MSLIGDIQEAHYFMSMSWKPISWPRAIVEVLYWRIYRYIVPIICRIRGHQWENEVCAESGYESVWCVRCGTGHNCYMN